MAQKLTMYALRDAKAGVYLQPFFKLTEPEAVREIVRLTRDPQSMVSIFPEDYDLYQIGEYADTTGIPVPLETPRHIAKAIQFKQV